MNNKITLEYSEELIDLRKLDTTKLEEMIQTALEFENYEMCHFIQKIINNKKKTNKIMSWKLNIEDENPLWRQYMDNVDIMDNKWLKPIELETPFPSKNFSVYSEDEFLEKLKTDEEFNKMWGELRNS